ncbi:MAG: hypothetical protein IPI44_09160 [Sulfuritalea sp.]|nr:hypothetical protein [Sulfuritalea sp.]
MNVPPLLGMKADRKNGAFSCGRKDFRWSARANADLEDASTMAGVIIGSYLPADSHNMACSQDACMVGENWVSVAIENIFSSATSREDFPTRSRK